jgi:hypothetical protein
MTDKYPPPYRDYEEFLRVSGAKTAEETVQETPEEKPFEIPESWQQIADANEAYEQAQARAWVSQHSTDAALKRMKKEALKLVQSELFDLQERLNQMPRRIREDILDQLDEYAHKPQIRIHGMDLSLSDFKRERSHELKKIDADLEKLEAFAAKKKEERRQQEEYEASLPAHERGRLNGQRRYFAKKAATEQIPQITARVLERLSERAQENALEDVKAQPWNQRNNFTARAEATRY